MRLLWIHYKGKTSKYVLLLELGRTSDKIIGIDTKGISTNIRKKITSNVKSLKNLSLDKKIVWLKNNCPHAMPSCKSLLISNSNIVKIYDIPE